VAEESLNNTYNYHDEFPCLAKNMMQILSKIGFFGAKSSEIAHAKTALAAKTNNFFIDGFLFFVIKD
jgi:hypothetical protein